MDVPDDVLELDSWNFRSELGSILRARGGNNNRSLAHIRAFKFEEETQHPVSAEFCHLSIQATERRDSPHIVALHARCESAAGLAGVQCWALANVRTLFDLSLYMGPNISQDLTSSLSFLQALIDHLPMLQILKLDAKLEHLEPGQRSALAAEVTRLCSSLHNLSVLRISLDIIDSQWRSFFAALSQLPNLKEVSFVSHQSGTTASSQDIYRISPGGLPSLHSLYISASPLVCSQVLRTLSASILKLSWVCPYVQNQALLAHTLAEVSSYTLSTNRRIPSASFALSSSATNALFSIRGIPQPVTMSSLTEVHITILDAVPGLAIWTCLQSLFPARGMHTFSLRCPYPLSYRSEDLLDLFQAWPEIQHLSLNPRPFRGALSWDLPPLAVLATAARSAPRLESVAALLDGRSLCLMPSRKWDSVQRLDLGYSVGPSSETRVEEARTYIRELFPGAVLVQEDCSLWVQSMACIDRLM
ncbi:hypothetical protein NM688_g4276 [Phlebia brevispora]|uniref:Uncharacterized protein n=1 Tax=Phlebia brevispora TaxID=194682 RepID=A0ACC1T3F8_9APHY|nr:hypothetical protein NM688_g4276 [Phlebia brevispora]